MVASTNLVVNSMLQPALNEIIIVIHKSTNNANIKSTFLYPIHQYKYIVKSIT